MLPLDVMAAKGVREEDVLREGPEAKGLKDVVFEVATRASDHLITARQMVSNVREGRDVGHAFEHEGEEGFEYAYKDGNKGMERENGESGWQRKEVESAFGVYMRAVSVGLWLQRLERVDFDVFKEELRKREWRLPWKAWLAYRKRMF